MGGDRNIVHIIDDKGVKTLPEGSKADIARALMRGFAARAGAAP